MKETDAVIQGNREVAGDTFLMELQCDLPLSVPGQFVMLGVNSTCEPFLRRPLAILSRRGDTLELLYKVKGKGTSLLAGKKRGEVLSVLGPLGKGFSMPEKREETIYVAGGTGLPPILALAERISRGCLVIGARDRGDIPLLERILSIEGVRVRLTTENGSLGREGMATDELAELLIETSSPSVIYACGPNGMLKKVAELAQRAGARCEVSLEEYMACGFGVCSACVVETASGNQRVCAQGPVFDAFSIRWRT